MLHIDECLLWQEKRADYKANRCVLPAPVLGAEELNAFLHDVPAFTCAPHRTLPNDIICQAERLS